MVKMNFKPLIQGVYIAAVVQSNESPQFGLVLERVYESMNEVLDKPVSIVDCASLPVDVIDVIEAELQSCKDSLERLVTAAAAVVRIQSGVMLLNNDGNEFASEKACAAMLQELKDTAKKRREIERVEHHIQNMIDNNEIVPGMSGVVELPKELLDDDSVVVKDAIDELTK